METHVTVDIFVDPGTPITARTSSDGYLVLTIGKDSDVAIFIERSEIARLRNLLPDVAAKAAAEHTHLGEPCRAPSDCPDSPKSPLADDIPY